MTDRILLIIWTLAAVGLAELKPNRNLTIPANTIELQYSHNQKYLIAASETQASLFWGVNGSKIGDLDLQGRNDVSAVRISRTNLLMAVGFKDGLIKVYKAGQELTPDSSIQASTGSQVTSLCFTKDDEHLVIGLEHDLIAVYSFEDDQLFGTDFRN